MCVVNEKKMREGNLDNLVFNQGIGLIKNCLNISSGGFFFILITHLAK